MSRQLPEGTTDKRPASMRLAPRPLRIGKTDGFTEQHDTFGASQNAERLADLVSDLAGHSVIVLDGDWGSGKSTFVRQWAGMMRNRNHVVVEFDAFEADHHEDAFFSLLTTLLDEMGDDRPADDEDSISWRRSLRKAALGVGRVTPGILARAALPGPLGVILAEAITHTAEQWNESKDEITEAFLSEHIDTIAAEKGAVGAFREELSSIVQQVSESNQACSPLVFIIDELDRCKPSFALDVLERMKHVFAADGVCFLLVTHLAELTNMVEHAYGVEAPGKYLEKFYHLKIDINQLLSKEGAEVNSEYIRFLCSEFALPTPDLDHTWFIAMSNLARLYGLTLRSVERVVRNLAVYAKTNRYYPVIRLMDIAAGLCVMREVNPDLYKKAAEGRLTSGHATEFLQLSEWNIGWSREGIEKTWKRVTRESSLPLDEHVDESPTLLSTTEGGQRPVAMSRVVRRICEDIDLFAQSE